MDVPRQTQQGVVDGCGEDNRQKTVQRGTRVEYPARQYGNVGGDENSLSPLALSVTLTLDSNSSMTLTRMLEG